MPKHITRDLPNKHVTLRPYIGYPSNRVKETKFNLLPITEVSYIGSEGAWHKKERSNFKKVNGKILRWGVFNRQVYCAEHPLMDDQKVLLKKGQKFVVAWTGNIINGEFRPLSLRKGLFGSNDYTHYQMLAEVVSHYSAALPAKSATNSVEFKKTKSIRISHENVFIRRELIDGQVEF